MGRFNYSLRTLLAAFASTSQKGDDVDANPYSKQPPRPVLIVMVACVLVVLCCGGLILLIDLPEWLSHPGQDEYAILEDLEADSDHVYLISIADFFPNLLPGKLNGVGPWVVAAMRGEAGVTLYAEQPSGEFERIEKMLGSLPAPGNRINYALSKGTIVGSIRIETTAKRHTLVLDDEFAITLADKRKVK